RSRLQSIASLKPGKSSSLAGRILSCGLRSTRRPGFKIFDAVIDDGTASIRVSWLNQPFLRDVFATGQHVVLFGPVEMRGSGGLPLTNPQYEIFEEAFLFHTGVAARRRTAAAERKAIVPAVDDRIRESARRVLPFKLTGGQRQSLKEIVDDLQRPQPMNRLLQGDVGAGKTIVA